MMNGTSVSVSAPFMVTAPLASTSRVPGPCDLRREGLHRIGIDPGEGRRRRVVPHAYPASTSMQNSES